MIVGLLAMLFMIVTAYITLARFDRLSLRQAGEGARIEQILDSIADLLRSNIAQTWTDEKGALKLGGDRYADVVGADGTAWLAASEPVRDVRSPPSDYRRAKPEHYRLPGVSSLPVASGQRSIQELAFDRPEDVDERVELDPFSAGYDDDTIYNAQRSYMDADGDGIPDSYFGDGETSPQRPGVWLLTELANAMGGRVVWTNGVNPAKVAADDPAWRAFYEAARYITAARVISHGGMVQFGLPLDVRDRYWNRDFLYAMLAWIRHPNDRGLPTFQVMRQAWAERASIEPLLRLRGGLLVSDKVASELSVPASLAYLIADRTDRMRWTFLPQYEREHPRYRNDSSQRFNLARANEWDRWRLAVAMDPDLYNDPGPGLDPREWYVRRPVLTAQNLSDELARDQDPDIPRYDPDGDVIQPGISAGQPKFYLGRLRHAFDSEGRFKSDGPGNRYDGYEVLRDLVNCYSELLADYEGWDGELGATEAVTRREQAVMLAVNTLAFAAPRGTGSDEGQIDNVWYADGGSIYIGYTPQPFITQVLVFRTPDDKLELMLELYNPNDRLGSPDSHALDLGQFGVSFGDAFPADPAAYRPLAFGRLAGRTFMKVLFGPEGGHFDSYFTSQGEAVAHISDLPITPNPTTGRITVKLWKSARSGGDGALALVDEFEIEEPDENAGGDPDWKGAWVDAWRDTETEPYWGTDSAGAEARWRCVVAYPPTDAGGYSSQELTDDDPTSPPPGRMVWLGQPGPGLGVRRAPTVPLYTMNAGLGPVLVHGAARPASFPTVGFMAFVPRFAHKVPGGDWSAARPMGTTLREQWQVRSHSVSAYPADFGHLPVFDNRQDVAPASDFTDGRAGRVPWGLLVFDYFTTLNPADANGDGQEGDLLDVYRVPGRININVAPWYVLAGLPVIGPTGNDHRQDITALRAGGAASPAFWARDSGILAGLGSGNIPRFIGDQDDRLLTPGDSGGSWWRLGPHLAQALAAYRDRVQYTTNGPDALRNAHARNAGATYRPTAYAGIRGSDAPTGNPGFLTLGEIANVVGFDSSMDDELDGGAGDTALGQGDYFRAASLLALLDTHFLTTRSNTFTIYLTLTVNDPDDPQASIRGQLTVDRSNLLPRLVMFDADGDGVPETPLLQEIDTDDDGDPDTKGPIFLRNTGLPEVVGQRQVAYFNTRYED